MQLDQDKTARSFFYTHYLKRKSDYAEVDVVGTGSVPNQDQQSSIVYNCVELKGGFIKEISKSKQAPWTELLLDPWGPFSTCEYISSVFFD